MTNRKSPINEGIQATNINAQSIAVGKGAQAIVNQNKDSDTANQVFVILLQKVAELPEGSEKEIAKNAVNALQAEAGLGNAAKESNVAKWLSFLAQTAPDIWDVAIATFANPIAGLGMAFKKVSERAREEKEKASSQKAG